VQSQGLEDEVLPGTETADQTAEEMSERHDHGKNSSGKIRIQLFAKSFILRVYDVLARHSSCVPGALAARKELQNAGVCSRNANYLDAV
jgi:hypothetical protein